MRIENQNLTDTVRESVIEAILAGKYLPGARIPSEREYAMTTGTSRITVRRAYAQLEQASIITRQPHGGTKVAETFRANTEPLSSIGLIPPMPFTNRFANRFVEAVSACCDEMEAMLVLGIPNPVTAEQQLKIAKRMTSRGIKDIIVWCADRSCDFKGFASLRILGVNLVFFDQIIPGQYADYVGLDNHAAVRALFRRAIERGARHLTFITYSDMEADTNREREEAFLECLAKSGLNGEIRRISQSSSRQEFHEFASQCAASDAVISVNAPLLQQCFHEPAAHPALYCVDHNANLPEINATGYCQPISAMAEAAFQMLIEQRRKGERWHATARRFQGELIDQ